MIDPHAGEPPFRIAVIPVTPLQQNCVLIWHEPSKRAAVIDPGGDCDEIVHAISETGAKVEKIVLTHGHVDHAAGADELRERLERADRGAAPGRQVSLGLAG